MTNNTMDWSFAVGLGKSKPLKINSNQERLCYLSKF